MADTRPWIPLIVTMLVLLFLLIPANESSAHVRWNLYTNTDCYPGITKGGVGVDCDSYLYLSNDATVFLGRTITRADEDIHWLSSRNLGVEICNGHTPNYRWDSWYKKRWNDDYVSVGGSGRVQVYGCLPYGSLNSHGVSDWSSGSSERSVQSMRHHPKAMHN